MKSQQQLESHADELFRAELELEDAVQRMTDLDQAYLRNPRPITIALIQELEKQLPILIARRDARSAQLIGLIRSGAAVEQ